MLDKRKYLVQLLVGISIITVGVLIFLNYYKPEYSLGLFVSIPVLALGMGIYFSRILSKVGSQPEQIFKAFVLNFLFKLLISLLAILIVYIAYKEQIVYFMLIFLVYYLGLLVFETRAMIKLLKSIQKHKA